MRYKDLDKRTINSIVEKYNISEYYFKIDILKIMHSFNEYTKDLELSKKREQALFAMTVLSRLAINEILTFPEMRSLLIQTIKEFKWQEAF